MTKQNNIRAAWGILAVDLGTIRRRIQAGQGFEGVKDALDRAAEATKVIGDLTENIGPDHDGPVVPFPYDQKGWKKSPDLPGYYWVWNGVFLRIASYYGGGWNDEDFLDQMKDEEASRTCFYLPVPEPQTPCYIHPGFTRDEE